MPTMTLSVPEDLQVLIKKHNHIKWSEIARRAMWDYARKMEILDQLTANSELTDEDVHELDKVLKAALSKHYPEK
ncbi:MAG: hypothetical protein QGG26_16100 [Candidatus Undinarchaeales archaeon]|jgi:hypothetical protein|nr:hypothetical protein [Candidatus Undinarchaeales archaeon]